MGSSVSSFGKKRRRITFEQRVVEFRRNGNLNGIISGIPKAEKLKVLKAALKKGGHKTFIKETKKLIKRIQSNKKVIKQTLGY